MDKWQRREFNLSNMRAELEALDFSTESIGRLLTLLQVSKGMIDDGTIQEDYRNDIDIWTNDVYKLSANNINRKKFEGIKNDFQSAIFSWINNS